MNFWKLLYRSILYFARSGFAVALGVAVGSMVLTGALFVGDSLRGTLQDQVSLRLGDVQSMMTSKRFFKANLPAGAPSDMPIHIRLPIIYLRGSVAKRTDFGVLSSVGKVNIYGVPPEFWENFPTRKNLGKNLSAGVFVNHELAEKLEIDGEADVVLHLEKLSAVPRESLLGDRSETIDDKPIHVAGIVADEDGGAFSFDSVQHQPRNLFIPISQLSKLIGRPGEANLELFSGATAFDNTLDLATVEFFQTADSRTGLVAKNNVVPGISVIETSEQIIDDDLADRLTKYLEKKGVRFEPVFTYVADTIARGTKEIPYSVVVGAEVNPKARLGKDEIALNRWAADQLGTKVGDVIRLKYFLPEDADTKLQAKGKRIEDDPLLRIVEKSFTLAQIHEMSPEVTTGFVADFPGITDAKGLGDWKAPFPFDGKRVKKIDDEYWKKYKTAPKAFVSYETAKNLWGSRFGKLTSVRLFGLKSPAEELLVGFQHELASVPFPKVGYNVMHLREKQNEAAVGSTEFGGLFIAFSFFLIIAAGILVALLIRLNLERRASQIGIQLAVGLQPRTVNRLFFAEGAFLALVGSILGGGFAFLYTWLFLQWLAVSWESATELSAIHFHWQPASLLIGIGSAWIVAWLSIFASTWGLVSARVLALLSPGFTFTRKSDFGTKSRAPFLSTGLILAGLATLGLGMFRSHESPTIFFVSAFMLLIGSLGLFSFWLSRPAPTRRRTSIQSGTWQLGMRNAGRYPERSLTTAALVALAVFVIAVIAFFRNESHAGTISNDSGNGGYSYVITTDLPVFEDPETLFAGYKVDPDILGSRFFLPLRRHEGDDASCLNLYKPKEPTLVGASKDFIERGGFSFAQSLATESEKTNPWSLLEKPAPDEIPAIGDANTLQWILHLGLGDTLEVTGDDGQPHRLKIVGSLAGSIFQSELLISESNFQKLFPNSQGKSFFLSATYEGYTYQWDSELRKAFSRYGATIETTTERLAAYHSIENTYMATFQLLGGLGLALGTIGLGIVMFRNLNEREAELGLLRAIGFSDGAIGRMLLAENGVVLVGGLLIGLLCAGVAAVPRLVRAHDISAIILGASSLTWVVGLVLLAGLVSGWLGMRSASRRPIVAALRHQ